jgi:hypothetical protein
MPEEKALEMVAPAISPEDAKLAIKRFGEIEKAMLDEDDYQEFTREGKKHRFPKKSAFRKIALAFNLTDEILEERYETKGEDGKIGVWHFTVKATAPNNRSSVGVGSFSTDERDVAHSEHDGRAMAHTRAKNRAISDLVAGGILSAEEILGIPEYKTPPSYGKAPKAAPAKAPAKAETGEEALKKLRQQIAIEWAKTGKTTDERKAWMKPEYSVESMTELNEEQLRDMLLKVQAMIPTFGDLGFESEQEREQMRKELYNGLKGAGYDTQEKMREFLDGKDVTHTKAITKERMAELIEEVKGNKEALEEAEGISEEI